MLIRINEIERGKLVNNLQIIHNIKVAPVALLMAPEMKVAYLWILSYYLYCGGGFAAN